MNMHSEFTLGLTTIKNGRYLFLSVIFLISLGNTMSRKVTALAFFGPESIQDGAEIATTLRRNSLAANTRRAYASALRKLDAVLQDQELTDQTLAAYIGLLAREGLSTASAATAIAAVKHRAEEKGRQSPAGKLTQDALRGFRRESARRPSPRGQAQAITLKDATAMLQAAFKPRPRGRGGMESRETAKRRGIVDAAIVAVLFQAGLRRCEAAALIWADIEDAADGEGVLIHVRASKSNQEGGATDTRYVKGGFANALRRLRIERGPIGDQANKPVFTLGDQQVGRRFTATAKAAGISGRITAHSGRVGLASELTRRGASITETMLAGGWKTARMVAHYSAGATAERGAVAKYL